MSKKVEAEKAVVKKRAAKLTAQKISAPQRLSLKQQLAQSEYQLSIISSSRKGFRVAT